MVAFARTLRRPSPILEKFNYYLMRIAAIQVLKSELAQKFNVDYCDALPTLIIGGKGVQNNEMQILHDLSSDISHLVSIKRRLIQHIVFSSTRLGKKPLQFYFGLLYGGSKDIQDVPEDLGRKLAQHGMISAEGSSIKAVPLENLNFYDSIKFYIDAVNAMESVSSLFSKPFWRLRPKIFGILEQQARALERNRYGNFLALREEELKLYKIASVPIGALLAGNPNFKHSVNQFAVKVSSDPRIFGKEGVNLAKPISGRTLNKMIENPFVILLLSLIAVFAIFGAFEFGGRIQIGIIQSELKSPTVQSTNVQNKKPEFVEIYRLKLEANTLLFGITKDDRVYFNDTVSDVWLPEMVYNAKYVRERGTRS